MPAHTAKAVEEGKHFMSFYPLGLGMVNSDQLTALLQSRIDALALVLLIIIALTIFGIVKILAPIWREAVQNQSRNNEMLGLIQQAIIGERDSNDRQTAEIKALRSELAEVSKKVVTIQVDVRDLPERLQRQIIDALVDRPRSSWLQRLVGF